MLIFRVGWQLLFWFALYLLLIAAGLWSDVWLCFPLVVPAAAWRTHCWVAVILAAAPCPGDAKWCGSCRRWSAWYSRVHWLRPRSWDDLLARLSRVAWVTVAEAVEGDGGRGRRRHVVISWISTVSSVFTMLCKIHKSKCCSFWTLFSMTT